MKVHIFPYTLLLLVLCSCNERYEIYERNMCTEMFAEDCTIRHVGGDSVQLIEVKLENIDTVQWPFPAWRRAYAAYAFYYDAKEDLRGYKGVRIVESWTSPAVVYNPTIFMFAEIRKVDSLYRHAQKVVVDTGTISERHEQYFDTSAVSIEILRELDTAVAYNREQKGEAVSFHFVGYQRVKFGVDQYGYEVAFQQRRSAQPDLWVLNFRDGSPLVIGFRLNK
jgi:hypothetical protein